MGTDTAVMAVGMGTDTAVMGTVFQVIPWDVDKSHGNTVGMMMIMQQTAVLKLQIYSYSNYGMFILQPMP